MNHKISTAVKILCWMLVFAIVTGCRFGNKLPPEPEPLAANEGFLDGFERAIIQRGDVVLQVTFTGEVNLTRQSELFFAQDGRLKTLAVQNGDFVRAGAVVAMLDIDDLMIELTQAEWDLEIVRKNHAIAKDERAYARQLAEQDVKITELTLASLLAKELAEPGTIPSEKLAEIEQQLTQAQLELKRLDRTDELEQQKELIAAEVQVAQLQEQLEESRLVAPFDGNIYLLMSTDDLHRLPLGAYEPVMRLVDPTSLRIEATPAASDLEWLAEAMPVSVALTYRPGVVLPGVIDSLPYPYGNGGDPFARITVPAEEQHKLRVGGAVQIQVEVQRHNNVLWLPPHMLQKMGVYSYATVRDGQQLRDVRVDTGLQNADRVEILSGLQENEIVIRR